jgi:hypothetical protein
MTLPPGGIPLAAGIRGSDIYVVTVAQFEPWQTNKVEPLYLFSLTRVSDQKVIATASHRTASWVKVGAIRFEVMARKMLDSVLDIVLHSPDENQRVAFEALMPLDQIEIVDRSITQ